MFFPSFLFRNSWTVRSGKLMEFVRCRTCTRRSTTTTSDHLTNRHFGPEVIFLSSFSLSLSLASTKVLLVHHFQRLMSERVNLEPLLSATSRCDSLWMRLTRLRSPSITFFFSWAIPDRLSTNFKLKISNQFDALISQQIHFRKWINSRFLF
jgi:hypothetical protein